MDCSMDRLLGGSVFVSPLAEFSMSPDTGDPECLRIEPIVALGEPALDANRA